MIDPSARYKKFLDAPVSDDIGSRIGRRRKVVALYGSYFLICVATAVRTLLGSSPWQIIAAVLLLAASALLRTDSSP